MINASVRGQTVLIQYNINTFIYIAPLFTECFDRQGKSRVLRKTTESQTARLNINKTRLNKDKVKTMRP